MVPSTSTVHGDGVSQRVEELLAQVKAERARRHCNNQAMLGAGVVVLGLVALVVVLAWFKRGRLDLSTLGSLSGLVGLIGASAAISTRQKQATQALAEYDDLRGVGPLAEALSFDDAELRPIATEALMRLLPRLQASDAHLLDAEGRKALNKVLRETHHRTEYVPLARVILKAYEQVGSKGELAEVTALAALTTHSDPAIRSVAEAAQECLPFLERRIAWEVAQKSLLRASSVEEAFGPTGDTLLRPATGSTVTDTLELLRPALPEGTPYPLDAELVMKLLRELEVNGEAQALLHVEALARSSDLTPELQRAAERCAERIRARLAGQEVVLTR